MQKNIKFLLLVCCLSLSTALVCSGDQQPFQISVVTTDNNPITVTATGSNLTDLINNLIKNLGQFQQLNGHAFTGTSTFLGVPNAIVFNVNSTGTVVNLNLTPIAFNKTFNGTSQGDVENQVTNFIEKSGSGTVGDFLSAIAKMSAVAVTDGNPNAATASSASTTFMDQGFTPATEVETLAADTTTTGTSTSATAKPSFGGLGIGFNSGKFKAAGIDGENTDVSITGLNFGLGPNVRLVTPVGFSYLKVAGARVGGFSVGLGLPITVETMGKDSPYNWRITPMAATSVRGSVDLASGALLWQAGLTNTVDYKVSSKLIVCVVNQLTTHHSIAVDYGDYHFDPKVDQQILKNGLRFVTPLNARLIGDFFVIDTRFLKDAAVKSFETLGGSLSFRITKTHSLTIGFNYDTGDNFKAYSVGLSSAWRW